MDKIEQAQLVFNWMSFWAVVLCVVIALVLKFSNSSKATFAFFGAGLIGISVLTYANVFNLNAVVWEHPSTLIASIVLGAFGVRFIGEWLTHKAK